MLILGIETSCDETAAAVVENGTKILRSVVASSSEMHQKTGGVIPEQAAREQLRCIIPVIDETLNKNHIDAIAVTVGPGLIGSLLVGVETAKTLAFAWNKPVIPVNHLVAHLYANWLISSLSLRFTRNDKLPEFPAVCMVVSGGHTDLVLMKGHGKIKLLGSTRDDAAGECFDKTARLLGLSPYYGGPAIAAAAKLKIKNSKLKIKLPRPMIDSGDFDFSFSGLKTAVVREVEKLKTMKPSFAKASEGKQLSNETINHLAYEVQEAVTDVLVAKVIKAAALYKPKSILLAGGVSANQRLREKLKLSVIRYPLSVKLFVPAPKLCTDNASYIASCAYFNYRPVPWQKVTASSSLTIV